MVKEYTATVRILRKLTAMAALAALPLAAEVAATISAFAAATDG